MRYFDDFPDGAIWGQYRGMIAPPRATRDEFGVKRCIWCGNALPQHRSRARACDALTSPTEYCCEAKLVLVTSWTMLRQMILERDSGMCVLCGESAYPYEVDHIRRIVDGGTDDPKNLRTLCRPCHVAAGVRQRAGGS